MQSITNLKYLLTLRKTLHFAKAATQCFVSQSTLSAGIKKLEQDLGVILFERNNKKVVITPVGEKIALQAEQVFFSMQNLEKIATLDFFTSEVKIGVIPTISAYLLPSFMAKIKQKHPNLHVIVIEDTSSNLLTKIENFALDFAIFAFPFDNRKNIVQHGIFTDELYFIKHKHWGKTQDEITDKSFLMLEQGHCLREHIINGWDIKSAQISDCSCTNLETITTMVGMQTGISLIPKIAINAGILDKHPNIISTRSGLSRDIGIVYHRSNALAEHFLTLSKYLTV